jgi:hypothetical protein
LKVDTNIIAKTIAEQEAVLARLHEQYERIPDFQRQVAAQGEELYRLTENLGKAIQAEHPRFNAGRFEKDANPIRSERLKNEIVASFKAIAETS